MSNTSTSDGSLVHNQETVLPLGSKCTYRDYCFLPHKVDLLAAETAYAGSLRMNPQKKLAELASCKSDAWFHRHNVSGEIRVSSHSCKLRWCPVCSQARKSFVAAQVAEWIHSEKYPKLLTLTLKSNDLDLTDQIDRIYKSFARLKRMKFFDERVSGGIWFFQLTRNERTDEWHPHLHCIIGGKYLPHRELNRVWAKASFDSFITDVKMIRDPQNAANEVARYCSRPVRLASLPESERPSVVDAFFNRRLCGTWGTGKAASLRNHAVIDKAEWRPLGTWSMILGTQDVYPEAAMIVKAWRQGLTVPEDIVVPNPLDDELSDDERSPPETNFYQRYLI